VTRFHRMGVWAHAPEVRHRDVKEHHGVDAAGAGDRGCSPGASGPGGKLSSPRGEGGRTNRRTGLSVETGYPQGMILPTPPGITPTTAEQDQQHYDDDDEGRGAHERFLQYRGISVGRSATKGYSNDTLNQPPILSHVRLMDFRIRDGTSALSGKARG
jgi:hypothetical protein